MAVSATSCDDTLANFSSTGPEIEIVGPDENIYSTVIGGYDTFDGTSMACPYVSSAGAGLLDTAAALGVDSIDTGTDTGPNC